MQLNLRPLLVRMINIPFDERVASIIIIIISQCITFFETSGYIYEEAELAAMISLSPSFLAPGGDSERERESITGCRGVSILFMLNYVTRAFKL